MFLCVLLAHILKISILHWILYIYAMKHLNFVLGFVYCLLPIIIFFCFEPYFSKLNIPYKQKWFIFILFIAFIFNLIFLSNALVVFVVYLILFISFILTNIVSIDYKWKVDCTKIFRCLGPALIPLLIFLVSYIVLRLMVHKFNDDSWWINENNISDDIERWGDFATFFGGIFALISIYLAYRAFISQVNASRRASFDATFTQIFAQHKILYDKAMQHNNRLRFYSVYYKRMVYANVSKNIFYICKNEYKKKPEEITITKFWEYFNKKITSKASVDFKNYLKYIHNEVEFVASQPDNVLNDDAKQRYIQLIQAQMNNDELFCYLINKVEFMYRNKSNLEEDTRIHAEHLKNCKFFIELCRGKSGHVDLVKMMLRDKELDVSAFIDENWIQKGKS